MVGALGGVGLAGWFDWLSSVVMRFELIDRVVSAEGDRGVAVKAVSRSEEYLQDHFPGFPVLPGVFMLEALVQTARAVLWGRGEPVGVGGGDRLVLGEVRALKYGTFVSPGDLMRLEVWVRKRGGGAGGAVEFGGEGRVGRGAALLGEVGGSGGSAVREGGGEGEGGWPVCVSGRFTVRPVRLAGGV